MHNPSKISLAFFTVCGLYGLAFILNSSFEISGERYFTCADDVMITMDYARNIAEGNGFVWYPGGGRVEGASSLLWVVLLAGVHLLVNSARYTPGIVQVLSLFFLLLGCGYVYRMGLLLTERRVWLALAASGLTFFYSALFYWSIMGFEVSLAFALVMSLLLTAVKRIKTGEGQFPVMCLLFAALILLRNELGILCIFVLLVTEVHRIKDIVSQRVIAGFGVILLIALGITLFRFSYFGEILPNTYYLKMTGYPILLRMARGLYIAALFFIDLSIPLIIVSVYGLYIVSGKHGWRVGSLLAAPFVIYVAYSIYIGGDAWEYRGGANRWISPFMGLFMICLALGAARVIELLSSRIAERVNTGLISGKTFMKLIYMAVFVAIYFQLNLCGRNPVYPITETLMLRKAMGVEEVKWERLIGNGLRSITKRGDRIALIVAGTMPYHLKDRQYIDLFGYNDAILSKQEGHISDAGWSRYISYLPGCVKWDLDYSLAQLRPDVIVRLPGGAIEEFGQDYLGSYRKAVLELPEINMKTEIWVRKAPDVGRDE